MLNQFEDIKIIKRKERFWNLSQDILCIIDFDHIFRDANPSFERILGYTREEVVGKPVTDFLHPDDIAASMAAVKTRQAGQAENRIENRYRCKDGSYKWLAWNGISVPEERLSYDVARDITEIKNAEIAVKESEEQYRKLFNNMTESFSLLEIVLNKKGKPVDYKFLDVNPAFEELIGKSRHNLIGKKASEVLPFDLSFWSRVYGKVASTGQPVSFEKHGPVSGQWFEVYVYCPQKGRVAALHRLITDRKKLEEALVKAKEELEIRVKERTADLAASEEKYRLLVENANEAVLVTQDEKIKFCNSRALELFGYSKAELTSNSFFSFIHPDDREMVFEISRKRIRGEKVPIQYEHRIQTNDRGTKWVSTNVVRIIWEGRPASLGLLTDITQRKNMEQDLKKYAQRITQVQEEERKRIAYELHDDTAQYLSILKLQLDSILHSGKIKSPEILKKLELLEKDAGRAVDDVRRYSHELRPGILEHLGLRAALEQIAEDINKLKQVPIEVLVEGEELKLSEDIKLGFFRIAQEALNNVRKHSKASKASIILRFHNNQVRMVVNDNGVGFDLQESISRSKTRGSLGLMSMHERAEIIGADLKIVSKLGKGTQIITTIEIN